MYRFLQRIPRFGPAGATALEELQLGDVFEGTVPWIIDRDYI